MPDVTLPSIRIPVILDTSGLSTGSAQVKSALGGIDSGADKSVGSLDKLSKSVRGLVGEFAGMELARRAFGIIGDMADQAGEFERSMNQLRVATKATDEQMDQFAETARRLGKDAKLPGTSSKDAADAMLELSKAGLSVEDSMNATRASLQLAAIANIKAGESAKLTANILNQFGLAGNKASQVADLLSGAANSASGEITDMAYAMTQVGAQAHAMGIDVTDTTTSISLMAKAGILGSDAGTSLKTMLQQLSAPTDNARDVMEQLGIKLFDNNGKFIGLREASKQYEYATRNLTDEQKLQVAQTLAGTDGSRALLNVISKGPGAFDAQARATKELGDTEKNATELTKGYKGQVEALGSAWESFLESKGSRIIGFFGQVVEGATNALDALDKLIEKMEDVQGANETIKQASLPGAVSLKMESEARLARAKELRSILASKGNLNPFDKESVVNKPIPYRLAKLGLPATMDIDAIRGQAEKDEADAAQLKRASDQQFRVMANDKMRQLLNPIIPKGKPIVSGNKTGKGGPTHINLGGDGGKKDGADDQARREAEMADARREADSIGEQDALERVKFVFDRLNDALSDLDRVADPRQFDANVKRLRELSDLMMKKQLDAAKAELKAATDKLAIAKSSGDANAISKAAAGVEVAKAKYQSNVGGLLKGDPLSGSIGRDAASRTIGINGIKTSAWEKEATARKRDAETALDRELNDAKDKFDGIGLKENEQKASRGQYVNVLKALRAKQAEGSEQARRIDKLIKEQTDRTNAILKEVGEAVEASAVEGSIDEGKTDATDILAKGTVEKETKEAIRRGEDEAYRDSKAGEAEAVAEYKRRVDEKAQYLESVLGGAFNKLFDGDWKSALDVFIDEFKRTVIKMAAAWAASGLAKMLTKKEVSVPGEGGVPGLGMGIVAGDNPMGGMAGGGISDLIGGIASFIPGGNVIGGAIKGIGKIFGFDKGGMLPDVAMVHKGEMLVQPRPGSMALPAQLTKALMSGGRGSNVNVSIQTGPINNAAHVKALAEEVAWLVRKDLPTSRKESF